MNSSIGSSWPGEPMDLLREWCVTEPGAAPLVMTVCTIDEQGVPDARTLVLSGIDEDGVTFHTDDQSAKVAQLAARPEVALVLTWPVLARQVVVRGRAVRQNAEVAERAFRLRPRHLQLLAWLNTAELIVLPEAERRARWDSLDAECAETPVPMPGRWTGYAVSPGEVTFWSVRPGLGSERHRYVLNAGTWSVSTLPG
jgi:pyridoxamine 5'-phosphate oxidase